jgi:uncharacterized protein YijF (DUF1287 family)
MKKIRLNPRIVLILAIEILCLSFYSKSQIDKVIENAQWQTTQDVTYDPSYVKLDYPMGDVPSNTGVCTDVVIRALRVDGKDLQELIYKDISANLDYYNLSKTNKNIDHRRCKNVIKYFKRNNKTVPITSNGADYKPGDIVFWDIAAGHVGIVSNVKVPNTDRYYVIHNICCGPQSEDFLFSSKIVLHVRL